MKLLRYVYCWLVNGEYPVPFLLQQHRPNLYTTYPGPPIGAHGSDTNTSSSTELERSFWGRGRVVVRIRSSYGIRQWRVFHHLRLDTSLNSSAVNSIGDVWPQCILVQKTDCDIYDSSLDLVSCLRKCKEAYCGMFAVVYWSKWYHFLIYTWFSIHSISKCSP